jgi:hypothetical protein
MRSLADLPTLKDLRSLQPDTPPDDPTEEAPS